MMSCLLIQSIVSLILVNILMSLHAPYLRLFSNIINFTCSFLICFSLLYLFILYYLISVFYSLFSIIYFVAYSLFFIFSFYFGFSFYCLFSILYSLLTLLIQFWLFVYGLCCMFFFSLIYIEYLYGLVLFVCCLSQLKFNATGSKKACSFAGVFICAM
jgi:hypothetical protein